ncbi:thiamine diphosphokinase [Anaerorhabdus sp.]|uniref:thiamine diphosphokinase n=1 Tax=Anaerorhabdus sp. TaxID=1872524 RepID=UPI002FC7228E
MLKRAILVANIKTDLVQTYGDYIGIDRGALHLANQGKHMVLAVGDFDSIEIEEKELVYQMSDEVIQLEPMKDFSDSQAAIHQCKERGYEEILFYGGLGKRFDHHYVNERMLMNEDINLKLIDDKNCMVVLREGTHLIEKNGYKYLSLFAIEDAVVTLTDVKYPLDHYKMDTKNLIGLSNEIVDQVGMVCVHAGKLLCMQTND